MKLNILEASLIQIVLYSVVFYFNSYIGFLLCLTIGFIAFAILVLSLITEMVERSKVPKSYYKYMATAILSPFLVLIIFILFDPTVFSWLDE